VTALTRNKKKNLKFLKKIGVDNIIETKKFILPNNHNLLTSKYDGVIDSLGGEVLTNSIKMLADNGVCIAVGLAFNQKINNLTVLPFLLRGITLVGSGAEVLNKKDKKNALNIALSLSKSKDLEKITHEIKLSKVGYYLKNWSRKPPGRIIVKIN
jgi:NADPH:quinone reductase-like Zn-dependent oxidoreductase